MGHQPDGTEEGRTRRWKLIVGVLFCLLAVAMAAAGYRDTVDKPPGEIAGGAAAPLLLGAVLTLVGRAILKRGRIFDAPGFVLCTGAIALAVAVVTPSASERQSEETTEQVVEAFEAGPEACGELVVGRLGGGYRAKALNEREARAYGVSTEAAAAAGPLAGIVDNVEVMVTQGKGTPKIITLAFPLDPDALDEEPGDGESTEDVLEGARQQLAAQGAVDVREVTISGEDALTYEVPGLGFGVFARSGCHLVQAYGPSASETIAASDRLFAAQPG